MQPSRKPSRGRHVRLRVVALLAAGLYLGVVAVFMALENALIYHPAGPDDWYPPPPGVRDVEFTSAAGDRIHGWWLAGEPNGGAVLYSHGNAGNLSYRGEASREWVRQTGCSVLIYDYPGYGRSTGRPGEAGCYAAGRAALDWLVSANGVPAERVILFGKSLGGGVAVQLATERPHRALVLSRAFTSLPEVGAELFPWVPVRWVMRTRFDNVTKLRDCRRPVFLHHGRRDTLVAPAHAQRLLAAAPEPKELVLDDGDHNSPFAPEFWVRLRDFLNRHASD
jgi:hypothetical protein